MKAVQLALAETAQGSSDNEEGVGRGREREGDNLNGNKAKEMQRIAKHLLKSVR
jgi:hypothetical protein